MYRAFLIFCFMSCSFKISAQKLTGSYYGEYDTGTLLLTNTTTFQIETIYDKVKIRLKQGGKFEMDYRWVKSCPAQINSRFCSGRYTVNRDTIYLQSEFSSSEFYQVEYLDTKITNSDSSLVIIEEEPRNINKCLLQRHPIIIETDDGFVRSARFGDSLLINNQTNSMIISMVCPTSMDWFVDLNDLRPNSDIKLSLFCNKDNENISLDNIRMLISGSSLLMIDKFYFMKIKNNLFIKNNR